MLEFKELDFDSFKTVRKYFLHDNAERTEKNKDIICDHIFGTTFIWRHYYNLRYTFTDGCVVFLATIGGTEMFTFPMGEDIPGALRSIGEYAHNAGINIYFCFIAEDDLHYFNNSFDIVFSSEEKDWSDYVYDLQSIADLSGRAYHRQKNHLNKYRKTYPDCGYYSIDNANAHYLIDYVHYWNACYSDNSPMACAEHDAVCEILNNWDSYGMTGGFITSGSEISGFTIGEAVGDTVFVHIEKADHTVPGAYQLLSSEYLKTFDRKKYRFVNREEDMGIEGIRKSKHALHPVKMLKKYTLFCCWQKKDSEN